jgi:hypothetical protein
VGNRWRCYWAIHYTIGELMSMSCGVVISNSTWVNAVDVMW